MTHIYNDPRIPIKPYEFPAFLRLLEVVKKEYPDFYKAHKDLSVIQMATILLLENKSKIEVATKLFDDLASYRTGITGR